MANEGYDKDADQQHSPSGGGGLWNDEQNAADNPFGGEPDDGSANPGGPDNQGNGAGNSFGRGRDTGDGKGGFGRQGGDADNAFGKGRDDGDAKGAFGRGRDRLSNGRDRLRKLGQKKLLLGIGAGVGGSGLIGLLLLIFLVLGALKIPNFAEHITAYQFTRVTSEYAKSAERLTEEELALQSTDDSLYAKFKNKYQNLRDNTWGKFDNYRPDIITKNLQADNNLDIKTGRDALGRQRLLGITLDNQTYLVKKVPGPYKFIPGVNKVLQIKNEIAFSQTFFPILDDGLQDKNIGFLVRGVVANDLRKKAGISLAGLVISKFAGETPDKAALQVNRQAYNDIEQEKQLARIPKTQDLRDAAQAVENQQQQDVANDSSLQKILANGGVDPAVSNVLNNAFASSGLKTVLNFLDPTIAIGMPICIVYDGSLENSGPTIDKQTTQEQRAYYLVASTADQEKYGNTNTEAVSAMDAKLGDITQSNAEIRAGGGVPNTNNTLSTQASADGQFTILDALLPSGVAGVLDTSANLLCPILTNTGFAVGFGVVQLAATLATGGVSGEGEQAAKAGADSLLGGLTDSFFSRFFSTKTGAVAGKAGDILTDTVKTGGKIAGATIAAKLIVMGDAGALHNGLEQNTDFTNEADAGGNYTANQLDQTLNYGRPLTVGEALQSNQQSLQSLADQTKSGSLYTRYADLGNANSLFSRVVVTASGYLKPTFLGSLLKLVGDLFSPFRGLADLLKPLQPKAAFAAANTTSDTSDYGNVQFGWSRAEEQLIDSNATYQSLENQYMLDSSGHEDEINSKYGRCFTDTIGTLLSGSDNNGNPEIVRDKTGNVVYDQGLCSPRNLGYNSPDSLANDGSPDSPQPHDMIFRWRLAHRYSNALDNLNNVQNAGTASPAGG